MRPITVQVARGKGKEILELAGKYDGKNISLTHASDMQEELDVVSLCISNRKVEYFIDEVNRVPRVRITLYPHGVMPLYPPEEKAPDQVADVEPLSPIEIFLAGLQSIGSWKGFISYAIVTGVVVWIGFLTNTTYLLVAAMLIAPFAGPAMNTAIATARGDLQLLKHSLIRYFLALLITMFVVFVLTLLYGQEVATELAVDRSKISSMAVLLSLAAGAAGAINLVQSNRDSLVSGAAVGMLVAASLAPPVGVVGMAVGLQKWEMATSGIFILLMQLIGINLAGAIIFRLFGLNTVGSRFKRGKKNVMWLSGGVTVMVLSLLLAWQFNSTPDYQRSSRAQQAEEEIQQYVQENSLAAPVEVNARFTRADIKGQNTLLCVVYVQKTSSAADEEVKQQLSAGIRQKLKANFNVTPVVDVIVLEAPEE